jgi:hypothetical protein
MGVSSRVIMYLEIGVNRRSVKERAMVDRVFQLWNNEKNKG